MTSRSCGGWRVAAGLAVVVVAAPVLLCVACARPPAPQSAAPAATARNVLIVTIDTLRADRVGVYGAGHVETPNLDRLAREGAWAPQATVPAALTRPSHVSLFTGLYPAEHGIRDNIAPPLRADVPVLGEILKRQGFSTGAFVASVVLDRQAGLARGFDRYSDRFGPDVDRKGGEVVVSEAIEWLRGRDRFLAWAHLYDVHAPYVPPPEYAAKYPRRPYDAEVAWTDALVGRMIEALRTTGRLDDTLVVVTSDHGEGLGDHGEATHGYFAYESTLRVPLVIRGPGVKPGTQLQGVARMIDLLPTVLELTGSPSPPQGVSGHSLATALRGDGRLADEPAFAESLLPLTHFGWSDLRVVRDGRWKYILAPRPELYDLDRDPGERQNLVASEPARAQAMRAGLTVQLQKESTVVKAGTAASGVPPELLERLGALGYVSPGGSSRPQDAGADPKDHLDEYQALTSQMLEGLLALRQGRAADALPFFRALRKRGADSFELRYYLGRTYAALGRAKEAAAEYEQAVARQRGYADAWRGLGESRVTLGDRPGAAAAFEALVAVAPADALARMELGQVYRDQNRMGDAARVMREATSLDPEPAAYWNALGTVLGASRQMADAERAFAEAARRDGSNGLFLYNHAIALEQIGRPTEALAAYEKSAALAYAPAAVRLRQLRGGVR
ncbi:MAG: sulfatase-like hydrolase/transferase [Vicinamibacterales bacterium]